MRLFAADALLPQGWRRDVRVDVAADGTIASVVPAARPDDAERLAGPLVPGIPNVHSHAFQRALAGRTGRRSATRDSFWTWRQAMYAFLDRVDADAFEAIAAQAYVEMLRAGYTAVAEFHYVHHDPSGNPYADPAELAQRIVRAAREAGIALTLLPVFYAHSGFGGAPPVFGQRRFVHTLDSFARLVATLASQAAGGGYTLGIAPHSLRAVTPDELAAVTALAPRGGPLHLHAAEQQKEVADCLAWSGARPVEWLLANAGIDARWCVIHATHQDETGARRGGAVAGLASTTEADLGDGTFPARAYLEAGGALGVGSDSNTKLDPFAELRQLDGRSGSPAARVLATAMPVGQARMPRPPVARGAGPARGAIAPGSVCRPAGAQPTTGAHQATAGALLDARSSVLPQPVARSWSADNGWCVRRASARRAFSRYAAALAQLTPEPPTAHGLRADHDLLITGRASDDAWRCAGAIRDSASALSASASPGTPSVIAGRCRRAPAATRGRLGDTSLIVTHAPRRGQPCSEFERDSRRVVRDIAREGGGINATVRATRAASDDGLLAASRPRLAALAAEGVTTVEIKSGYGLDTANECRLLHVARRVAADVGVDVRTTLLAAHTVPSEYAGRADDYVELVHGERGRRRRSRPGRCGRRICEVSASPGANAARVRNRPRCRSAREAPC
jgi:formimidoylglutamate deiminase